MQSGHSITLRYPFLRKIWPVLLISLFGNIINQLFNFSNPAYPVSHIDTGYAIGWYLFFFITDQVLIECISIFILFRLVIIYARIFKLHTLHTRWQNIFLYELAFLPLFAVAFFFFNPITQTVRFFYEAWPHYSWATYRQEYGYLAKTYMVYLGPVIMLGYLTLNLNLLMEFIRYGKRIEIPVPSSPAEENTVPKKYTARIFALDKGIEKLVPVENILWFFVEDRIYYAHTSEGNLRIKTTTMNELEDSLNPEQFLRLNRYAIANVSAIDSMTPWFKGKQTVKMKSSPKTEFIVSAERAREIKERLGR